MSHRFRLLASTALITLLCGVVSPTVRAEPTVRLSCDTSFDPQNTVRAFPGAVYSVLPPYETENQTYQLQRTTKSQSVWMHIPLPENFLGRVLPGKVSPDGKFLFFTPFKEGRTFWLWKIGTDETASLTISDDDVAYFTKSVTLQNDYFKITWESDDTLLIRYFDLSKEWFYYHQLAERRLFVTDNPLRITAGERMELPYPPLTPPEKVSFPRPEFSPKRTYVSLGMLQSDVLGDRIQLYDASGQHLLMDIQSDHTREIENIRPGWISDESMFFYDYSLGPNTSRIMGVHVDQGFTLDASLQTTLEKQLGTEVNSSIGTLHSSENELFVFFGNDENFYTGLYSPETGDLVAACDHNSPGGRYFYFFWGPSERYYGYWQNDWIVGYDLLTGEGYRMEAPGFAGWIADNGE
jgi:hypothetical protein